MRFELASKRMQAVSFTNCCWYTVPYNWAGHREDSIAKFRSCPWNSSQCWPDAERRRVHVRSLLHACTAQNRGGSLGSGVCGL